MYAYQTTETSYHIVFSSSMVEGHSGSFGPDGSLNWFSTASSVSPFSFSFDYKEVQYWQATMLGNVSQAANGMLLDSQQGLVVGGEYGALWHGWMGKFNPSGDDIVLIYKACLWWYDQPQLFWLSRTMLFKGVPPNCVVIQLLGEPVSPTS
jgi:hypothetical protein